MRNAMPHAIHPGILLGIAAICKEAGLTILQTDEIWTLLYPEISKRSFQKPSDLTDLIYATIDRYERGS